MTLYAVTFHSWWAAQTHPHFPAADPGGYIVLAAATVEDARNAANGELGMADGWAAIVPVPEFNAHLYPAGVLGRWSACSGCGYHDVRGQCCDQTIGSIDCGPCCPQCPTCPTEQAARARAAAGEATR